MAKVNHIDDEDRGGSDPVSRPRRSKASDIKNVSFDEAAEILADKRSPSIIARNFNATRVLKLHIAAPAIQYAKAHGLRPSKGVITITKLFEHLNVYEASISWSGRRNDPNTKKATAASPVLALLSALPGSHVKKAKRQITKLNLETKMRSNEAHRSTEASPDDNGGKRVRRPARAAAPQATP